MDEAIAFLQEFVKREHEARYARAGDPDPVFNEKRAAVESMLAGPGFTLHLARTENPSPEQLAGMAANERPSLVPRRILVVQRYQSDGMGELYRAILSFNVSYAPINYYLLFVVQRQAEGLKIISYWTVCRDCNGAGQINGKRCPICFAAGWIRPNGVQIGDYGKLIETRKLEPPTDPVQRADYDAL